MGQVVIATMTLYKSVGELRAKLALKLAEEAKQYDYKLVVVDGGSAYEFVAEIERRGAIVYPQETPGLGPAHQQLFTLAAKVAGDGGVVDWIEAEKWRLVAEILKANELVFNSEADLVMPCRTEEAWASYPPVQMHQEKFCNLVMKDMFPDIKADWFWGPFAANQTALRHFIEYQGEGYNCRSVPKIHAIAAGLRIGGVAVNYTHPPEQTAEESANLFYDMRRVKQVEQVAAMEKAVRELGLLKQLKQ